MSETKPSDASKIVEDASYAKVLEKLGSRLHIEQGFNDQKPLIGHIYIQPGIQTFFVVILTPLAIVTPMTVITILNSCMNYAPYYTWIPLSLFLASFAIYFTHLVMYNSITQFCTRLSLNTHHAMSIIIVFSMTSALGCVNLYSYYPSLLYWVWGTVCALTSFLFYLSGFVQRHHFRSCSYSAMPHLEQKRRLCSQGGCCGKICTWTFSDLFVLFTMLFMLLWIGFVATAIQFSSDLFDSGKRPNGTLCTSFNVSF